MNLRDLGKELEQMYKNAPQGEQVAHIHLFGIKYADIIYKNKYTIKDVIDAAGINKSYSTELSKGIKLSKYVESKI